MSECAVVSHRTLASCCYDPNEINRGWELIDVTILPSAYEQANAEDKVELVRQNRHEAFAKTVIYTFRCPTCGKITQAKHEHA